MAVFECHGLNNLVNGNPVFRCQLILNLMQFRQGLRADGDVSWLLVFNLIQSPLALLQNGCAKAFPLCR